MSNHPTPYPSSVYANSIVGRVRDHNEDAVMARSWTDFEPGPYGLKSLLAVADGMGGHQKGEWASQTALSVLKDELARPPISTSLPDAIKHAIAAANKTIYESSDASGSGHPGTTLTIAAISGRQCLIASVGDSRLYLLRNGALKQITKDDTWAAELVRRGQMTEDESSTWAHRNQLTKAVGIAPEVEPTMNSLDLRDGDVLLLCSDGLSGMISDREIENTLARSQSSAQAAELLCTAAENAGGEDNISVVLYAHGSWPQQMGIGASIRRSNMETGVPSAPRTADPIPQMKRLHFKPIRIGWWLLVIAFLLGAGFRLIIHSTGGTSNGNTPNPATSTEQTSSGPATQPAAEPAGQPVRIEVELDSTKGVLRISSPDHKAIEFVGTDKPAWNERKGEYKFKDFAKSRKMLDSGEARLDVIGPGSASLVSDSKGRWHADIDAPGSYDVIWSAKNDTLGSFIVKRLGSGAHDE